MDVVSFGRTVRCIAINLCDSEETNRNKKRQTCRFCGARNGLERRRQTIRALRRQIRSPENGYQDRRTQSSTGPSASALEVSVSHDERLVGECPRKPSQQGRVFRVGARWEQDEPFFNVSAWNSFSKRSVHCEWSTLLRPGLIQTFPLHGVSEASPFPVGHIVVAASNGLVPGTVAGSRSMTLKSSSTRAMINSGVSQPLGSGFGPLTRTLGCSPSSIFTSCLISSYALVMESPFKSSSSECSESSGWLARKASSSRPAFFAITQYRSVVRTLTFVRLTEVLNDKSLVLSMAKKSF